MKYKLLAIDLDGTLLSKSKKISNENLSAIQKYINRGGTPVITTGRSIVSALKFVETIDKFTQIPSKFIVAFNGAYICDLKTQKITTTLIPEAIAKEIYQYALENNIATWFYTPESTAMKGVFTSKTWIFYFAKKVKNVQLFSIKNDTKLEAYKINLMSFCKNKIKSLYKYLQQKYTNTLNISFTKPHLIEINFNKINKGNAILAIAKELHIKNDEIAAIGDSMNDLPVFQIAAESIAIKPKNKLLSQQVKHVIPYHRNAVADAITRYILDTSTPEILLIASDLDGTLLTKKDKTINPMTVKAIQELVDKKNVKFALNTGRGGDDCVEVIKNLHIKNHANLAIVGCNGCFAYVLDKKEYLYTKFLHHDLAVEIFNGYLDIKNDVKKYNRSMGCFIHTKHKEDFIDGGVQDMYINDVEYIYKKLTTDAPGFLKNNWAKKHDIECSSLMNIKNIYKIVFYCDHPDDRARLVGMVQKNNPPVEISMSSQHNLEIMPAGCTKGYGLERLCAYFNVSVDQTMPIGDEQNDIPMLKLSPYSVTLKSSSESVKKAAKIIIDTIPSDLVGEAINNFVNKPILNKIISK